MPLRPQVNNLIINFICFQVGWFSCVLGAAGQRPWLGVVVVLPLLVWHLINARYARSELLLMLVAGIGGSLFDQSLLSLHWVKFADDVWPAGLLPLWMTALWMLFATTLNISLRWMRGRYVIATMFGLIGGPLSYLGGARLGAMELLQPTHMVLALGVGWAIFMPTLLWISCRLDGYPVQQAAALQEGLPNV